MGLAKFVTLVLSVIAVLTGAMDVLSGIAGQANIGVGPATVPPYDPVLDSQVRFLGAVWLGFGVIQAAAWRDIVRHGAILQVCYFAIVLGGIARVLSLCLTGIPTGSVGRIFIVVALIIELVFVPLAWIAVRRYAAQSRERVALR